jgi:hypothetical protein
MVKLTHTNNTKTMKKSILILPLLIIMISFIVAPAAFAACTCYCEGLTDPLPDSFANLAACDAKCQKRGRVGKDCKTISSANTSGCGKDQVCIIDPINIGDDPAKLYARVIGAFLGFVGVASLVTFVYAGFSFLISAGNPEKIKKAKDIMLYAVIGIIVSMASYAILNFIFTTIEGATGQ